MPDLISLMSQEMMKTFAGQKERLEEEGRAYFTALMDEAVEADG